jgi:hypothetical protein
MIAVLAAAMALVLCLPVPAADNDQEQSGLPEGISIDLDGFQRRNDEDQIILEGAVTIRWNEYLFQADRVVFLNKNSMEATGNVLIVWGPNRISGTRLQYWKDQDRGIIYDAFGQVEPEFLFTAATAEKVGKDTVYLKKAMVTTCTQPRPYWSFRMTSARLKLNGYARLWNMRLKVGKVPAFWMPFLLWPVKEGRSPGILLPEIHTTNNRGRAIALPVFFPLGRSADLTVIGRDYSEGGPGGGFIFRAIPNRKGTIGFVADYIQDEVAGEDRYSMTYKQTQEFLNGFRMVADVNSVSDFNYFNDFERDLRLTSSPSILARVEFSRSGRRASMNIREFRRKQLFADGSTLVQQTLPEIEIRGRSQQLGKLPIYLSYETSMASIQQSGIQQGVAIDADYYRADFFPVLSAPISRVRWLDITPKVSHRWTWYSQSQLEGDDGLGNRTREILDEDLNRGVSAAALEIAGPKIYKIFERPDSEYSKRYKHSIEPTVTYAYQEGYDRSDEIITYDEVDRFGAAGNSISYGIRSRLFAQRPRSAGEVSTASDYSILMPDRPAGMGQVAGDPGGVASFDEPEQETEDAEEQPLETIEIATLEIRQSRSYNKELSFADLDGDGELEEMSSYSPINLIGRLNPKPRLSFDLRSSWHPLYKEIQDVALSGSVMNQVARVRFSLVHRAGLGVVSDGTMFTPRPDDTQVQLSTGLNLFGGKLRLGLTGTYDHDPSEGQSRFPERQWRVQYSTQCCTFYLESLDRGFTGLQTRDDFYFRVDLRGVGKILDQRF